MRKSKNKSWGFVQPKTKEELNEEYTQLKMKRARQKTNKDLYIRNEKLKQFIKERDEQIKKKLKKPKTQSLKEQFIQIQKQVSQQPRQVQVRQPQQVQQPVFVQPEEPGLRNFFDGNKSFTEVYGDEELTFFDSNKGDRIGRKTGSFFGI